MSKKQIKTIVALVLAGLLLVVILQNTDQTSTRLLFVTVTMPRAALLACTMLIGVIIGALFGWSRK